MTAKLIAIILTVAATAALLLMLRQQRIQAVHELSVIHRELSEQEATLWMLRTRIAEQTQPERVQAAIESLELEWSQIPDRPFVPGSPSDIPIVVPAVMEGSNAP